MIVIVDDDESVRLAMKSLVRSLGYDAVVFESAEKTLESPLLRQAQCVISDVQMPGMDGETFQHELRASFASLPVIFITAFADDRRRERMLANGAVCYLHKPVEDTKLVSCIEAALGPR